MKFKYLIIYFLSIKPIFIFCNNKNFDFSGYYLFSLGMFNSDYFVPENFFLSKITLRLNFVFKQKYISKFDSSLDFNIFYGLDNEFFKINNNFFIINENIIFNLDIIKLYFVLKHKKVDFYFGRQLINFGVGYLFNPLNLFSKLDFTKLELRRGSVDCMRFKAYLDSFNYFEAIFLPQLNDFSTRLGLSNFNYDLSLVFYYQNKYKFLYYGLSFKEQKGFYCEILFNNSIDKNKDYFSYMLGFDYPLFKNLILKLEYLYNSFNLTNFSTDEIFNLPTYPFLLKQYILIQTIFNFNILDNLSFILINSIQSNKKFYIFSYKKVLSQNINFLTSIKYLDEYIMNIDKQNIFNFLYFNIDFQMRF